MYAVRISKVKDEFCVFFDLLRNSINQDYHCSFAYVEVKRKCRTSIRTPTGSRTGPRHSLKFRDNISLGGRSPRLSRR